MCAFAPLFIWPVSFRLDVFYAHATFCKTVFGSAGERRPEKKPVSVVRLPFDVCESTYVRPCPSRFQALNRLNTRTWASFPPMKNVLFA